MNTILVIGQATLHWGRLEFGNIGNDYVIEPFFLQLRRVFPNAEIRTTLQMSDGFVGMIGNMTCVPMEYFYGWKDDDLANAYKECALAGIYKETGSLIETTGYLEEVQKADLLISFHGDIWGQNADFVGPNRFLVGLLKDRTAQLMGKKTVMIAGSPGPFNRDTTLDLAHEVFNSYDYVSNREPISKYVLKDFGFNVDKVVDAACPAFIFDPASQEDIQKYLVGTPLEHKERPVVGFILCGWNLLKGPFSREDWTDDEFDQYVDAITELINRHNVDICLMSHSNGFELPPHFKPIHGRDYPLAKRLYEILKKSAVSDHVYMFDGLYNPKETKAIIANFNMLISGRVHGAIAGLSQNVPTVIIDYGHEPKAHKLKGFAQVAGIEDYVADPANVEDIKEKVEKCWCNKADLRNQLIERNKIVRKWVEMQFDALAKL